MDAHVGPHLGQLPDDEFAAGVARVADVLAVAGPADQDRRPADASAHVPQGVARQLRGVQPAGVVRVDRLRRDLEDLVAVVEPEDVAVGPVAQPAVLRQAVPADTGAGEDHVRVRRAHLDRLDDLDEVDAVAFGEEAPLVQERENRRAVGVLDDLGRLALQRAVHDGQLELLGVQDLAQELLDTLLRGGGAAGTDTPEIPDARDVLPAGHDTLVAVGQQRDGP